MTQLHELAKPFPQRVIKTNPSGGGVYVGHHLYAQRLLMHLGAYSFERVEVLRGYVPGKDPNPQGSSRRGKEGVPALSDAIVGVICRLTVTVDGERMVIEDVGDCEDPHNWPHDGARLKDAMSDALKRCCARIGLGTHLYAKEPEDYVLARVLSDREKEADQAPPAKSITEQNREIIKEAVQEGRYKVKAPRKTSDTADPTLLDEGRPFTEDE